MRFQTELVPAILLRRYKRFFADCRLQDGREVTAHCPNTGSMTGICAPGTRVWLEPNDDPKKKLNFGWRLNEYPDGTFVGVDTSLPNRIVREAFEQGRIDALAQYSDIRAEVKYGENSRIDFLLTADRAPDAYVEVKSVTLCRTSGLAEFPDGVTARGTKHMSELAGVARAGHRAIQLYLVQRTDCTHVAIAQDYDPVYHHGHRVATLAGVETLCISTHITHNGITAARPLAFCHPTC